PRPCDRLATGLRPVACSVATMKAGSGRMTDPGEPQLLIGDLDYRAVLATVAGYAIIADCHRRIRWVNRAPTGRSIQDFLDTDLLQLVVEAQHRLVTDAIARI